MAVVSYAAVAAGSAPWAALFAVMHLAFRFTAPAKLDRETRAYWSSSIVSSVFGVIISLKCWSTMLAGGFWTSEDLYLSTPDSHECCYRYLGYLVADIFPLAYYGLVCRHKAWGGVELYMGHHVLSILAWALMGARGQLHAVAVGLLLVEATAPFTNTRWMLSTLGMTSGVGFMVNGVVMALSFFVLRVLMMGGMFVRYVVLLRAPFFALPPSTWAVVLGCYGFGYPLQLFWFSKIFKGVLKVLGITKPSAKKTK